MRDILCKVFRFLLDLVGQVVDLVANTLIKIGTAAVEVLSEVAGAVSSAVFSNPLLLVGLGIAAWWLLSGSSGDEDDKGGLPEKVTDLTANQVGVYDL